MFEGGEKLVSGGGQAASASKRVNDGMERESETVCV
jgi:hypothetical protein